MPTIMAIVWRMPTVLSLAVFLCSAQPPSLATTFSLPVIDYEVKDVDISDALRYLVGQSDGKVVVGFERSSARALSNAVEPKMSIHIEHGTVQEVLRHIAAADARYTFSEPSDGVVNVYPVSESPEEATLLGFPLSRVDIKTREWSWDLFTQIPDLAPELSAYLSERSRDYLDRVHRLPSGTPGSIMMNKGEAPEIEIHLNHTTVRGLLNALAAYTLTHIVSTQNGVAQTVPIGWEFEFVIDPDADTGFGGYPKWKPFPFP